MTTSDKDDDIKRGREPTGMAPGMNGPSRDFCRDILPHVSRTFALSIGMLPEELQASVESAYLLCRIADSIEDDAKLGVDSKSALFDRFEQALHATLDEREQYPTDQRADALQAFSALAKSNDLGADEHERRLCAQAGHVFDVAAKLPASHRQAVLAAVTTMTSGMRRYCLRQGAEGVLQIYDMSDLERYCYYVAGTVGEMLSALFLAYLQDQGSKISTDALMRIKATAVPFGLGLQLVNILKDAAGDIERGVSYLPYLLMESAGVNAQSVFDERRDRAKNEVLTALLQRTFGHLNHANRYTLSWPAQGGLEIRRFCALPLALAWATLGEIENGSDTFQQGTKPKLSRARVMDIANDVQAVLGDDAKLAGFLEGLHPSSKVTPN